MLPAIFPLGSYWSDEKRHSRCTSGLHGKGKSNDWQQQMMRAAWQWRLLWVWLLVVSHAALALDPQRSLDHYGHQAWRTDSGLPQNTIHSILAQVRA